MYDLIILGAGPAGYYAAEKAGEAGMSVVLVEKSLIGGVCLNEGCIPSKTLLYSAKLFKQAKSSPAFGVMARDVSLDMSVIISRKDKVVSALRSGLAFTLKKCNVIMETGTGFILPQKNNIFNVQVKDTILEAGHLMVCTGSGPILPPIPGAEQPFVVTNKEILNSRGAPTILRNVSPTSNLWIEIDLQGVKSNRSGVGAHVKVAAGDLTQTDEVHSGQGYQSHYGMRLHFGLGQHDRIDRIEVRWIGGGADVFDNVRVDQILKLTEGTGKRP